MTNKVKSELKNILFNAFKNTEESGGGKEYRYFHGINVANITQGIIKAEKLQVDKDLLYFTALFHDIGKVKALNNESSIDYKSKGNLEHDNININFLNKYIGNTVPFKNQLKAIEIIHERPTEQSSVECRVLRDADELSNFGYMQVWRMITDAAITKKNIHEAFNYWDNYGIQNLIDTNNRMFFAYSKKKATLNLKKFTRFIKSVKSEIN